MRESGRARKAGREGQRGGKKEVMAF